ncbi:MAG: hypothetical protein COV43_03090 [Deltaproteobacteria bacterium CG11_big_fil_rev_8_21_14_0_20_42_23]|nr:MAG: hypothetical protein COV43_03090 [Deltaproteobacteria bacterium CG11_big_fil_rev_8_21_14_0_20_42_23]PJC63763.1 MAG: hypothetical protein CO021_07705 [Deltaproteobacteria bacterium CG_4_9_14_0_2_um_filter_42_21]
MLRIFPLCFVLFLSLIFSPSGFAKSYSSHLNSVSRDGKIYNFEAWDADLIWNASFFSDAFRNAQAQKHAKIKYLNPTEKAHWFAEQNKLQSEYWDFFVSVYTKKAYKQISEGKNTFWEFVLLTENGDKIAPLSVEMIPLSPYYKVLYPYIDRWSMLYLIRFPKVELGKSFSLTSRSVIGKSSLKWKVK